MKILALTFSLFFTFCLSAKDCLEIQKTIIKKYELNPKNSELLNYKNNGDKLLKESFEERLSLHNSLKGLSNQCKINMKEVFRTMREREDFIGAHYYVAPQISADSIDYKKVPPPIYSIKSYAPYHLSKPTEKFAFQSGDILITKGISFTSSTISEVVSERTLFSHIVFVYVDEATKKVYTMESYIGYGVKLFSIEEALKSENARILVLRSKDQKLARAAAEYMYARIKKSEKDDKPIPYDYSLDFTDNKSLSCEEIAYDAFLNASEGKFFIPENLSKVAIKDEKFLKKIGIKAGALMMPADLEVDSRFNIILDWTDYRIVRDSIRKDAVMGEIFKWMNEHNYKIHSTFRSIGAKVVWAARYIPGLWQLLAKLSGIPADFKKDVPAAAISTLESIKSTAEPLLVFITDADEHFHRLENRWMTPTELRRTINNYLSIKPQRVIDNFYEK
jgi:hypothetical protein